MYFVCSYNSIFTNLSIFITFLYSNFFSIFFELSSDIYFWITFYIALLTIDIFSLYYLPDIYYIRYIHNLYFNYDNLSQGSHVFCCDKNNHRRIIIDDRSHSTQHSTVTYLTIYLSIVCEFFCTDKRNIKAQNSLERIWQTITSN